MSTKATVILIAALSSVGGYHFWNQHEKKEAVLASADMNGFLAIPRGNGVDPNKIIILAARNCPRAGARRARALAQALADRHIPHEMWNQIHFNLSPSDAATIPALNLVMNGTVPIVLVHGRGEANPSFDQVVSEFNNGNDGTLSGD